MPNDLAPHKRARLDQWNAMLDEYTTHTADHVAGECVKPAGTCIGSRTADLIGVLSPIEAKMLLEIAIVRLAELRTTVYEPSFVCWVPNRPGEDPDDHEHDRGLECQWGWVCNVAGCTFRTDDQACPEHAPTEIPALRLVECTIESRHWIWVHRNDDYGHGCPQCHADQVTAELQPLQHKAQRHEHRWCWLTNRAKKVMIWFRLMRRSGWSNGWGYCSHTSARWRWTR